jgi:hypothetical protein
MKEIWQSLKTVLLPEQFYSWQMAIALSLLAWFMSFPTVSPFQEILVRLSWFFLIVGIGWVTTENPINLWGLSLSPWITGALVCLFLFIENPSAGVPRVAVITWPVIAGLVAIFPASFRPDSGLRLPPVSTRTRLLIIMLSNLLLTCWILLYYTMEDWLVAYPGLRQENFQASTFVYPIGQVKPQDDRGTQIVQQMAAELKKQVDRQPRSQVEQWLLQLQDNPEVATGFRDRVFQSLGANPTQKQVKDGDFWQFEIRITEPEYRMVLGARWMGPSAQETGYLMQQPCQISFRTQDPKELSTVTCGPQVNKIEKS